MAFKANYRQQRAERDRQARAKQAEKLKKLREKSEQRKTERHNITGCSEKDQAEIPADSSSHQTIPDKSIEQVESAELHVDYAAAAELFLAKPLGRLRGRLGYRRFTSAAEAIRFAIEELPPSRFLGVYMQVGDLRYDANSIRLLYERDDYPLKRSERARGP